MTVIEIVSTAAAVLGAAAVALKKSAPLIAEMIGTIREIRQALGIGSDDGDLSVRFASLESKVDQRFADHEARIVRAELQIKQLDCVEEGTSRACQEML